jgi:2-polyprenyl-3-methyl-5-hydroxy-6-metoxy-1,4-benzoquinol methylase
MQSNDLPASSSRPILDKCILCESPGILWFDRALNLSQCSDCGLIFDNPRPSIDEIAAFYSRRGSYNRKLATEEQHDALSRTQVRRVRRFCSQGDLLDIGAGFAQFLHCAQNHFTVTGTELSDEGIALAKSKYGIELSRGEVEDIDFGEKKFDMITMSQVLEHFPYPGRTLRHCISMLKDNGILYISVPNEASYSLRMVLPALLSAAGLPKFRAFRHGGHRKIDLNSMREIHLSHFSDKVLRTYLEGIGLELVDSGIEFLDPFTFTRGVLQVPRYITFGIAWAIRILTGANIYNSFWIAARKRA